MAVFGKKPEEPQNAKIVLADALGRVAYEADCAPFYVNQSTERVEDCAVGLAVKCVDRKVASAGILDPIVREPDIGVAPVGCDVFAQGRYLVGITVRDHSHGAVLQPSRNDPVAATFEDPRDIMRFGIGCNVDVANG